MKKNKLLNIAIIICKCIRILYILIFVLITGVFIHFQISPKSYKEASFNYKTSSFNISKSTSWKVNKEGKSNTQDNNVYALEKISTVSLYFIFFQFSATLIFIFLATKEFQKIMESVKNLKTFQSNNVASFKRIGKYIFIVFLLTSFSIIQFQQAGKSEIHLSLTPLLFIFVAFILAEIFKEGNLLQNENDLTI
jgi:hypothetical protein